MSDEVGASGVNGPAAVSARKIVTVAPLTGCPLVSSTVPDGSIFTFPCQAL